MKNMLDFLFSPAGSILFSGVQMLATVSLLLFMHFSAKHRNYKLSLGWYIAGFFFPAIAGLVFLSKRKRFPGPNMKVCPICGDKYPEVYQVCGRCLIDLPENVTAEKKKEKTISKAFGWGFVVLYSVFCISIVVFVGSMVSYIFEAVDAADDSLRIACTAEDGSKVYYDRNANAYEDAYDVIIYGKDGETYTYEEDEEVDEYGYNMTYYVSSEGEKFVSYDCYVDEEGYFFYDEDYTLFFPDSDYESEDYEEPLIEEPESFDEFIDLLLSEITEFTNYKFYENYCVDEEGNKYYWADEASWNQKGELITAQSDPTLIEE